MGAFHQPVLAVCAPSCLETLPEAEMSCGWAKVIKYAALRADGLLPTLEGPVTEEVLAEADYIGSTKGIIEFTQKSDAKDFIIVTMVGVLREMELRNAGSGKRFHFAHRVPVCENMTAVTLEKVADCLANEQVGVEVPFELQDPAKKTLELMLEYAAR